VRLLQRAALAGPNRPVAAPHFGDLLRAVLDAGVEAETKIQILGPEFERSTNLSISRLDRIREGFVQLFAN
jgi:hypothetical protein